MVSPGTKLLHVFEGISSAAHVIAFSPDDNQISAVSASDNYIRQLTIPKHVANSVHDTKHHLGSINGLAFSPGSKFLVSVSTDKIVRLWTLDTHYAKTQRPA